MLSELINDIVRLPTPGQITPSELTTRPRHIFQDQSAVLCHSFTVILDIERQAGIRLFRRYSSRARSRYQTWGCHADH